MDSANAAWLEEMYRLYQLHPEQVDRSWQQFFASEVDQARVAQAPAAAPTLVAAAPSRRMPEEAAARIMPTSIRFPNIPTRSLCSSNSPPWVLEKRNWASSFRLWD
jgi:2-oxoglutarate dehydrogenase complex dehydrogenase (E1) component-like enzyme